MADREMTLAVARAIVVAWESGDWDENADQADDALHAAIKLSRRFEGTEFSGWFAPVWEWSAVADAQGASDAADAAINLNDYTMCECCEVLKAFAGGKPCDVGAILDRKIVERSA